LRKINENQAVFDDGGLDNSGQIKDGTASDPLSGSTVKGYLVNDIYNAIGAVVKASGKSSFNGTPETVENSEFLTALNNIIDSKIQAAVNALQTQINQCAKLHQSNVFTMSNTFKSTVNTESSVNHKQKPLHGNNALVDTGDINSYNFATKSQVSNDLSRKVSIDRSTNTLETNFVVGTTLLAVRNDATNIDLGSRVRVYIKDTDRYTSGGKNYYILPESSRASGEQLLGTWIVRGIADRLQRSGSDYDVYHVYRIY
jgi:hypothetical protein